MQTGPLAERRKKTAERLGRGDPSLAEPMKRLRRERWHLWNVLCKVYAGTGADPTLAGRWAEDAAAGGLAGRLQQGFLNDGLDRLADLEANPDDAG